MVRSRRVKEHQVITNLPEDSDDILYPSWVDTYYPNRPAELKSMSLHDFLAWHDMVKQQPSDNVIYYPMFDCFLKKRKKSYLINQFRYNPLVLLDIIQHTWMHSMLPRMTYCIPFGIMSSCLT